VPILLITRTIPLEAYDKHEHTSTEHQTAIAFEQNLKISRVYLVGKHLMQQPHNLRTGRVPNEVNRVLIIPHRVVA
jgi:hypothetical protein